MIRQSALTGRTFSTSSIQREVIQAQGHSGSNQNCTSSCDCDSTATLTATVPLTSEFPLFPILFADQSRLELPVAAAMEDQRRHRRVGVQLVYPQDDPRYDHRR